MSAQVRLPEIVKDLKRLRMQRIGLLQLKLRRLVLLSRSEHYAESEVQLHILLVHARKFTRLRERFSIFPCGKICADDVEPRLHGLRMDSLKVRHGLKW